MGLAVKMGPIFWFLCQKVIRLIIKQRATLNMVHLGAMMNTVVAHRYSGGSHGKGLTWISADGCHLQCLPFCLNCQGNAIV